MQLFNKFKLYIDLFRLTKPTGFVLLFWPCAWGLALGSDKIDWNLMLLFFVGSIIMRSAGCIINDLIDKDLDPKVARTRNRPIASGKISTKESIIILFFLLFLGLQILLMLNNLAIFIALSSMILVFLYPFSKRFTNYPQAVLGIVFNTGILIAYAAANNTLTPESFLLYISGLFWTIGYDTIYGFQDIEYDKKIGIKSTSIIFVKMPRFFVVLVYSISIAFLLFAIYKKYENLTELGLIFLILAFTHMLWQVNNLKNDFSKCEYLFKSNMITGGLIFLSIIFS